MCNQDLFMTAMLKTANKKNPFLATRNVVLALKAERVRMTERNLFDFTKFDLIFIHLS